MKGDLDRLLASYVDSGLMPMVAARVYKKRQPVYQFDYGKMSPGSQITKDAIFRICSLTKLFTVTAMLQLMDRGLMHLDDPVSRYIPSFRDRKVLLFDARHRDRLVPEDPPCLIRHLMTMTSGIPNHDSNASPVARMYGELYESIFSGELASTQEIAMRMGGIPAQFQPGEHFEYGLGLTIGAAIVERVSGSRFSAYLEENILKPLRLQDTGFWLPREKADRMCCFFDTQGNALNRPYETRHFSDPDFEDGSDGMISTMDDLIRFADMLQDGTTPDGDRLVSRGALRLMRTNFMNDVQLGEVSSIPIARGYGYGLGVRVLRDPRMLGIWGNPGEFGWYGHGGTWVGIDPQSQITMAFGTQVEAKVHILSIPRFYNAVMATFES